MDNLVVSYSELKAWRFCRQSHYFKYIDRITPRRKPRPLKVGSILHKLLEYHTAGKDWTPIIKEVKSEYDKMFDEEKDFYGNLPEEAQRIMEGYQKIYKGEKAKYLMIEKEIGPIPLTPKVSFKMRLDRLVYHSDTKLTLLCETKSGKKIPQEDIRIWDLQTILYVWALRQTGQKVDGILWDYIRTKPPSIPPLLKSGALSQRQDMDTTQEVYLQAIKENKLQPADYQEFLDSLKGRESQFYRRVILPVNESIVEPILSDARMSAREIYYLREHPVKTISGYTCPRCMFSSLCYAELRGLDTDFIREHEFMNKEEEVEYGEDENSD